MTFFEELQNLFIKGVFVLLASPLWFPLVKAVWEEFNEAMAEEGGLFGRPPSPRELEKIEQERALKPEPLIHEPWSTREEQRREARSGGGATPAKGGAQGQKRRGGF